MSQPALRNRDSRRAESGATIVIVTFFVVALFAFAALSLDVGNALREQRKAQIGTDAAALAALLRLTNTVQDVNQVRTTAEEIAGANGVTTTEISASTLGLIEVGIWSNGQFYANQTAGGRYNAVRVPARRTVPLNFGRVVGVNVLRPAVVSVAMLDSLSAASGLRPFTVSSNLLNNVAVGQSFTVNENVVGGDNSGQWGQLDYQNTLTGSAWYNAMIGGYQGLIPTGDSWAELNQGNDHVRQAFEYLIDNHVQIIIPVIDTFTDVPNNGNVNIVGFIGLEVTDYQNRGRNSSITFTLRQALGSGTGGGTPGPYRASGRFLVK